MVEEKKGQHDIAHISSNTDMIFNALSVSGGKTSPHWVITSDYKKCPEMEKY